MNTSKMTIVRTFDPTSAEGTTSTGLGLQILITSTKLTGGGQTLTFNSMVDLDMGFIATSMSLVSITNFHQSDADKMTWSFSQAGGLQINVGNQGMHFSPSGGWILLTFTYNRAWNRGVFFDYIRNTNFTLNMSPSPTASNFASSGNFLSLNYTSTNSATYVPYCFTVGAPSTGTVNQISTFVLQTRNSSNANLTTGGATWVLFVSGPGGITNTSFWVQDNQNGTYACYFIPKVTGTHTCWLSYLGSQISSAPWTVTVS